MVNSKTLRTIAVLPIDLIHRVDHAVREGDARSRGDFIARAILHELALTDAAAVDSAFELMAEDDAYQADALAISNEFAVADWEAFRLGVPLW